MLVILHWLEKWLGHSRLYRLVADMVTRYYRHNVGSNAAALTYYMIFAFFPLLIFLSSLLGLLNLQVTPTAELSRIIPLDVIEIMNGFLDHVKTVSSPSLLVFGLVFAVYFPMRAVSCLMDFIERAYEVQEHRSFLYRGIIMLIFAIGLALAVLGSILMLLAGRRLLTWASATIPIPIAGIELWNILRFILMGTVLLVIITLLYLVAPGCVITIREALPGAVGSLLCWLVYTVGFSFYVENMAHYSLVYGSIGAIIVLLMWLYATSVTIIMGAELNASLRKRR